MIKKAAALVAFIVVALLSVAGCTSPTSNTNMNTSPETNTATASSQSTVQAAVAQQAEQSVRAWN
jgi:hypothetical protein